MTYGVFWMYYECPQCGKKYKDSLDNMYDEKDQDNFGKCPECSQMGRLVGESGKLPEDEQNYIIIAR